MDFIGRQDIFDLIDDKLLPSKNKLISSESVLMKQFALCGLGGVGKTKIASEWVLRRKNRFDAIFWIRADEIAKLDHAFSRIAVALGLEEAADSKSHIVSRELVKGWLSKPFKSKNSNEQAS